jgi:hypothetical protein
MGPPAQFKAMTIRTSTKTVTFNHPFVLSGLGRPLPAGAYRVETDEELLDGASVPVFRRVQTVIHLQVKPGVSETRVIDPQALDAALQRDQTPKQPPRPEADRLAMARGDDDGMPRKD